MKAGRWEADSIGFGGRLDVGEKEGRSFQVTSWVTGDNGDAPEDGGLRRRFMEEADVLSSERELEMTVGL